MSEEANLHITAHSKTKFKDAEVRKTSTATNIFFSFGLVLKNKRVEKVQLKDKQ